MHADRPAKSPDRAPQRLRTRLNSWFWLAWCRRRSMSRLACAWASSSDRCASRSCISLQAGEAGTPEAGSGRGRGSYRAAPAAALEAPSATECLAACTGPHMGAWPAKARHPRCSTLKRLQDQADGSSGRPGAPSWTALPLLYMCSCLLQPAQRQLTSPPAPASGPRRSAAAPSADGPAAPHQGTEPKG